MILGGGLFGLVIFGLWVWAIFDVISTEESTVRNLPRFVWLVIVILLSSIGALAWLLLGRPKRLDSRPDDTTARSRYVAPEDGPSWAADHSRKDHYAAMDEELDRRIEEKRLQDGESERREDSEDPSI